MEQGLTTTTAAEPATLEQLTLEVKFYLGQTAQNIIEVGKRLAQAKELVPHGEWQHWLQDNFQLSYRTAAKFMQCTERFSNVPTSAGLQSSQMFELLALPADEATAFIEAKAAAGTPVEDMTVKKLREEVQQWKDKAEKATEDNERGKTSLFAKTATALLPPCMKPSKSSKNSRRLSFNRRTTTNKLSRIWRNCATSTTTKRVSALWIPLAAEKSATKLTGERV